MALKCSFPHIQDIWKNSLQPNGSFFFFFDTSNGITHSTQNALLKLTEKWKHALDKYKSVGTIFIDLPKPFDTINHSLLSQMAFLFIR